MNSTLGSVVPLAMFIIYITFNDQLSGRGNSYYYFRGRSVGVARNHCTRVCSQFALSRSSPAQTVSNINMAAINMAACKRQRARESKIEIFSGACISMDRRCDQFPNCKDFSDEESIDLVLGNHFWKSTKVCPGKLTFFQTNCQLVVKGDNYRADSSPFTVAQQERLVKTVVQLKVREAPS